jgi:hypothetical protein
MGAVHADVLKLAPTDSLGVVKVKSMSGMSKKVADLSAKLGVAAFNPDLADPLGSLKENAGLKAGLKDDGEFGIVLLPAAAWPAEMGGDAKPAIVLLFPVSDYAAFVGNFADAKTEGGISEVQWEGETTYVMQWGDYAALSPGKEYVQMKGEGVKLNAAAAKVMGEKDGALWANVPALKSVLGPKLAENKEQWLAAVEEELQGNQETVKYAPVAKVALSQVIAAADTFLSNAQGATVSLDITDAGLNYSVAAEFAGDSYLGKFVSAIKGPAVSSFTQGLPGGAYLVYGGGSVNGDAFSTLISDFAGPIVKEAAALEGGGDAAKIMDSMNAMLKSVKTSSFGMIAPRGALGTESLMQFAYYIKGDSKAYLASMKDYGESYAKAMAAFAGTPVMPFNIEYKTAAKTLDGVTFDILAMTTNPNPKTPEEAQMAQMMAMMYGPGGLSYLTGALDDSTVVMGMGLPDAALSKLIASGKAGSDELGQMANVAATTKNLPGKPAVVVYVALDEFIRTGTSYARQFGLPVNLQLPDNLPPIGVGMDAGANVLNVDAHVPTELVQSIVAAFIQMQMQQGGGGF